MAMARLARDITTLEDLQEALSETSDDEDIGWVETDKSDSLEVSDGGMTVRRNLLFDLTTDGIRAKVGYSSGVHAWEITWPTDQRGPFASVGIATIKSPLSCLDRTDLIGGNEESVGWNLSRKVGLYNNCVISKYPGNKPDIFVIPDKIMVVLDMDHGMLSFRVNKEDLGICATGLRAKQTDWYPAISTDIDGVIGIRNIQIKSTQSPVRALCSPRTSITRTGQPEEIFDLMENVIHAMNNPQVFSVVETGKLMGSLLLHFHDLTDVEQREVFGDKFTELNGVNGIRHFYGYVQRACLKAPEKSQLDDSLFRLCLTLSDSSIKFCEAVGRCGVLEAICKELLTLKTSYSTNVGSRYQVGRILGLLSKCIRALSINGTELVYHTPTVHGTMEEFCQKIHDIDIRCRATHALSYVSRPITDTEPAILQNIVSMLKVCTENSDHTLAHLQSAISTSGKELLEFIANLGQAEQNRKCLVESNVCNIIVWFLQHGDNSEKELAANCIWALTDINTRQEIDGTEDLIGSLILLKDTDNVALKQASEKALMRLVQPGCGPDSSIPGCKTRQLAKRLKDAFELNGAYFSVAYDRCYCATCHEARGDELYYRRGEPRKTYRLPIGWFKFGLTLPPRAKATGALHKWHRAFHGTNEALFKAVIDSGELLESGELTMGEQRLILSPSILYAGQDVFATPFTFSTEQTYIAKVAFQVLVRPGSYKIVKQRVACTEQIDPLIGNQKLVWSTNERGSTILYGLLIKLEE